VTHVVRLSGDAVDIELLPELGGRLHRLRAFGHDMLRTPDDPTEHLREPFFWGGYHMAPWCNRIAAETVTVSGHRLTPRANFTDGTAIHGRVYLAQMSVIADGVFGFDDGGDDAWPWSFSFSTVFKAYGANVAVRQRLVNRSAEPMPAGLGFHPWFIRPVEVAINGARVYATNIQSPIVPELVVGDFQQRALRSVTPGVDATWTDVTDPPVRLYWPALGLGATVTFEAAERHVVAAAPTEIPATAIEPQTHAPDGLRRLLNGEPGALAMLEPGAELLLDIGFSFEQISGGSVG
jgi:aldose 1-epimerase